MLIIISCFKYALRRKEKEEKERKQKEEEAAKQKAEEETKRKQVLQRL